MAVDRKGANLKLLKEANEIQDKTKEAVLRIQRQAAATEEIAVTSLDELRKQGQQMDNINSELNMISSKLDQSSALQNRFDVWAGNWLGGKKRAAIREAQQELILRSEEGRSVIKDVFENEKYDSLTRTWKPAGMTLTSNPTAEAPAIFDPSTQVKSADNTWLIDYSMTDVDAEGWTYAKDFATLNTKGYGDSAPKWNSYVRRRKWRYEEKAASGALSDVKQRNFERGTAKPQNGDFGQAAKIGFVPRNKVPILVASGLTSDHMTGKDKDRESLDEESAAGLARLKEKDAEIDAGLGSVFKIVDNLEQIAEAINEEVKAQTWKTQPIESNLSVVEEKQAIVNARQKSCSSHSML